MKYCKSCGAPLLDGFRFCIECGATADPDGIIDRPEDTASPAPAPAPNASGMPAYVPAPAAPAAEPAPPAAPPAPPSAPAAPVRHAPAAAPKEQAAAPAGLLSFDGAFVALLLFLLPGVGLITAIVWALGGAKNPSRRNLARAYLLLVLALCLFFGCMALLLHLVAGDQMARFFELLHAWMRAQ